MKRNISMSRKMPWLSTWPEWLINVKKCVIVRVVAALLTISLLTTAVYCEIHRARSYSEKNGVLPETSLKQNIETSPRQFERISTYNSWLFSILASILVSFSGILPLLIIPLEAGSYSKTDASTKHLNLLLSFAVGGLLGDVFLHLLPEAWAHTTTGSISSQLIIGSWVIVGILSFIIAEKVMSECGTSREEASPKQLTVECKKESKHGIIQKENGYRLVTCMCCHGNDNVDHKHEVNHGQGQREAQHKSFIAVTGYLNLFANCIDNFTHGLAVGGSFLVSFKIGALTTFAILIHEIPHEIGDFAILLRSGFSRWSAARAQLFTALGSILGAVAALSAESAEGLGNRTAWILPFTAGGFINISLVTVLPDLIKETDPRASLHQALALLAGVGVMFAVTAVL